MMYKLLFIVIAGSTFSPLWGVTNIANSTKNPLTLTPMLKPLAITPMKISDSTIYLPAMGGEEETCGQTNVLDPTFASFLESFKPIEAPVKSCAQIGKNDKYDVTKPSVDDYIRYWKLKQVCECYAVNKTVVGLSATYSEKTFFERGSERLAETKKNQYLSLSFQASTLFPDDKGKSQAVTNLYNLNGIEQAAPGRSEIIASVAGAGAGIGAGISKAVEMVERRGAVNLSTVLTKSTAQDCLPMREFLAYKSISQDPLLFSDIKSMGAFNPKDWDFKSLRTELLNAAIKSKKTSINDVLGEYNSRERQIMRRMEFLSANPLYKNLFAEDGAKYPNVGAAQSKLFASIQSNYGKCSDLQCVAGKRKNVLGVEREIFSNPDIALRVNAQAELIVNMTLTGLQGSGETKPYVASSPSVNVLVEKSEEEMLNLDGGLELLTKSCQDVNAYLDSSRDFARDLSERLNSVIELDASKNTEYQKAKKAICEQPRRKKDGSETLTFNEYLARRNKGDRKISGTDILTDYIQNYQGADDPKDLSLLTTFLRKNSTGGSSVEDAHAQANTVMTKEAAAKITSEATIARREMLDKDSKDLIASNPDIFGGRDGSYAASTGSSSDPVSEGKGSSKLSTEVPAVSTPSADASFSAPVISGNMSPSVDNFNATPVSSAKPETQVAKSTSDLTSDPEHTSTDSQDTSSAREKELEARLASLESEREKTKKDVQSEDYKKILAELETLKAQKTREAAQSAQEATTLAQTTRQVRASTVTPTTTPTFSQATNSSADRAPASVPSSSGSSFSSAVANLAPLSSTSGALAVSYQKALNDKYKVPASTPTVLVKEGEFKGKVSQQSEASASAGTTTDLSLSVSPELYTALASADPVSAQAKFQKELQGELQSLSTRPLGSIIRIKSGASTTLKFMVVKLNDQVYFEPIRVTTLKGLRDNLNLR